MLFPLVAFERKRSGGVFDTQLAEFAALILQKESFIRRTVQSPWI